MSMIGQYLRVTPDELRRAIEDQEWMLEFAEEITEEEYERKTPPNSAG